MGLGGQTPSLSIKLQLAALESPEFHSIWRLGAQRKGMAVNMMKKRMIPVLLALCMTLVLLPTAALADDGLV